MNKTFALITSLALLGLSGTVFADTIVCDQPSGSESTAQSTSAEDCKTGLKNPDADDIGGHYDVGDWSWADVGHVDAGSSLSEGFLTISIVGGAFGTNAVSIMWTIADAFWAEYGEAVISIHVGNGNNADPDHYAWLISEGASSGTIDYRGPTGFSNIVLWGHGEGKVSVPEPGTLALLGGGLLLLGLRRRSRKQL